jgi:endonuclease-3
MSDVPKLQRVVAQLRKEYGRLSPPPVKSAFELVLWEKVAYLATDERRRTAFEALRKRVGLTPDAIINADPAVLREIATLGGQVGAEERATRMQDAAALVIDEFGGSLDSVLELPQRDAMKALQRIYGIGEPGAERILLLMRAQKVLPLDSNGARTLCRIGYGTDNKNYSAMYKSVRTATTTEMKADYDWLIDAHLLTRRHGQDVCKTSAPRCETCVVRDECDHGRIRSRRE